MKKVVILLAIAALVAPALAGGPKPQPQRIPLESLRPIHPLRVAAIDADHHVGPWFDYASLPPGTRSIPDRLVWDSFEPDYTDYPDTGTGAPIGGDTCGLGTEPDGTGGGRFWYGATYMNPFATRDMQYTPTTNNIITGEEFCFSWNPTTPSPCKVVIQMYDEPIDSTCTVVPATFIGGIVFDFGTTMAAGNWYSPNFDLSVLNVQFPADGNGSFDFIIATYDPVNPDTLVIPTFPVQPMLWGTGDAEVPTPDPDRPGTSSGFEYDDDTPADGQHTLPTECYDYHFAGLCPDPLGAMMCFYNIPSATNCPGDMNCDGVIDFGDIDPFVAILSGSTPCNAANADVNGDGNIDFGDIDPFVNLLSSGATCP